MRIILKLFAAPFVLALTLLVAALSFCVSIATWAFGILSSICAICGLFDLFRGMAHRGFTGWWWLLSCPLLVCLSWPDGWSASWTISITR